MSTYQETSDVRSETDRRTILMLIEHCRDKDARIEELEEALRQLRRNIDDVVPRRD